MTNLRWKRRHTNNSHALEEWEEELRNILVEMYGKGKDIRIPPDCRQKILKILESRLASRHR